VERQRKRKLIGITIAALAVCGGGAAIAATQIGSGSGSTRVVTTGSFSGTAAPDTGSGSGLGGNLYNGGGSGGRRGFGGAGGGFPGGGFRGGGTGGFAQSLTPAAAYLGVTAAALQTEIQGGKTLAQVATAEGKSVDGLVSAMVDAQKTQFDTLVKSGRVTAAQAQQFESAMKQRITDLVNGTRPSFGAGGGGFDDGSGAGSGGSGTFGGGSGSQPVSPTA
jgi:hypothetical protein